MQPPEIDRAESLGEETCFIDTFLDKCHQRTQRDAAPTPRCSNAAVITSNNKAAQFRAYRRTLLAYKSAQVEGSSSSNPSWKNKWKEINRNPTGIPYVTPL